MQEYYCFIYNFIYNLTKMADHGSRVSPPLKRIGKLLDFGLKEFICTFKSDSNVVSSQIEGAVDWHTAN